MGIQRGLFHPVNVSKLPGTTSLVDQTQGMVVDLLYLIVKGCLGK